MGVWFQFLHDLAVTVTQDFKSFLVNSIVSNGNYLTTLIAWAKHDALTSSGNFEVENRKKTEHYADFWPWVATSLLTFYQFTCLIRSVQVMLYVLLLSHHAEFTMETLLFSFKVDHLQGLNSASLFQTEFWSQLIGISTTLQEENLHWNFN